MMAITSASVRHIGTAMGLRHSDRPKTGAREAVEVLRRQPQLAIALRRLDDKLAGKLAGNGKGFRIRADAVRLGIKFKGTRHLHR